MKLRNLLYAQSGGVTSVINTTAAGVIETARASNKIGKVYAGKNGISGILKEPPISTNCPLLIMTSLPSQIEFNIRRTAAALLLTIIELSHPSIELIRYVI